VRGFRDPRARERSHAVISTNADAALVLVSDAVFAAISATLQRAKLAALEGPTHNSLALPTRFTLIS
jgi:hypothetical protein